MCLTVMTQWAIMGCCCTDGCWDTIKLLMFVFNVLLNRDEATMSIILFPFFFYTNNSIMLLTKTGYGFSLLLVLIFIYKNYGLD